MSKKRGPGEKNIKTGVTMKPYFAIDHFFYSVSISEVFFFFFFFFCRFSAERKNCQTLQRYLGFPSSVSLVKSFH